MIKKLHAALTSNRFTRSAQRKLVRRVKGLLNVPDAYDDLTKIAGRTNPDAILDIGSHVGGTIARLLETTHCPIHGFEPTAKTFEKLSQRFHGNPLVTLHKLALSNQNGTAEFHNNSNEQTNSLLDNDTGNTNSLGQYTQHVSTEKIQTMKLDDWVDEHLPSKNIIIKSDVQGAEGLLLEGGRKAFKNQVIGFYSEAQIAPMYDGQADFCELHQLLTRELGFVLHNIYPCFHDKAGRALQTDAFWISERYLS